MLKKIEGLTPQWDDGLSKHTASTKKSNCLPSISIFIILVSYAVKLPTIPCCNAMNDA